MKRLLAGLLLMAFSAYSPVAGHQQKVYICVSASAYAYHKMKDCSGLNRCTHTIKPVAEDEAKNTYRRRKCRICY